MPKNSVRKKNRRLSIHGPTRQERLWQERLEKWRQSGLPGTVWCRRRGIKESAFRFWRKEIPDRERRRQEKSSKPQGFIEARLVGGSTAPFEVLLREGRTLRLAGDFDPAVLRKLVTTLEGDR